MSTENKPLTAEETNVADVTLDKLLSEIYKDTPREVWPDYVTIKDSAVRKIMKAAMWLFAGQQTAEKDARIKELEEFKVMAETLQAERWSLIDELEAVKKERNELKRYNENAIIRVESLTLIADGFRKERDSLKKQLETAVNLLENYRYMTRNDHDLAHLDMEADGFFSSLQTTGQDVKKTNNK